MKTVVIFLSLLSAALAATVPSVMLNEVQPMVDVDSEHFDVTALLPSGASTGATGDNAVGAVADDDSGAVGAKGDNVAFGASAPGMAVGFGSGTAGLSALGSIFGSPNDPAATPAANSFFTNFFN